MHAPVLVAIQEVAPSDREMWQMIDKCWVQEHWSASITPKGAYFCEVAAAMAHLFDGSNGWKVEPGWWKRIPMEFGSQMHEFCVKCGCSMPMKRRQSVDERDDISAGNVALLKEKSRKVMQGEFVLSTFEPETLPNGGYPDQVYKEQEYRDGIAAKYGIALIQNERGYNEPVLIENMPKRRKPLFEKFLAGSDCAIATGRCADAGTEDA